MRVAVVGTGRMGAAMARRLAGSGTDVVVHNRTRDRADALGLPVVESARAAAAHADCVLVSLANDQAVLSTYDGPDGLVAGLRRDTVVVETSTVDPETIRTVHPLVEERGATLLDAPVSGSVPVVERGELTFMVGGDPDGLARVRPILDQLGRNAFHVGMVGSGAVVKLAVNTVVASLNQALSEALVLAEKAGVTREAAYEVFANSAIAAPFVGYKRQSFLRPDEAPVAFTLELVGKDLGLILRLAERVGARVDQAQTNSAVVREAIAAGLGDADMSAIAEFLESGANPGMRL